MPTTATMLTFAFAALALVVMPGPNLIYIITRGIQQGRRAAVVSSLFVFFDAAHGPIPQSATRPTPGVSRSRCQGFLATIGTVPASWPGSTPGQAAASRTRRSANPSRQASAIGRAAASG